MTKISRYDNLDPISHWASDKNLIIRTGKQQVKTILDSYRDRFDIFSELIQNALDAVDIQAKQSKKNGEKYDPKIWIEINLKDNEIKITDNGVGMDQDLMTKFLVPHYTHGKDE